ncbi:hypothetical protein BX600DRAFT_519093 [Xylariales sp. PMI_506]|nr:hypothetical protein BX600DRAFT_519093 [Xylariales sp. PMI_506]
MTSISDLTQQIADFVICVGGTARLVLAARLSEDPNITVVVIEAGKNMLNDPSVDNPARFKQMFNDENYEWKYKTMSQVATPHDSILVPNVTVMHEYARGHKKDYDDWADLIGDDSWSYKSLVRGTGHSGGATKRRGTGVYFLHKGVSRKVSATREVILCGGAIGSPQMLEVSGIGDPEVLKRAGVKCLVSNPAVGNNLQDHYMTAVGIELVHGQLSGDMLSDAGVAISAQKMLAEQQDGPLTSISAVQGYYPFKRISSAAERAATLEIIKETVTENDLYQRQLEKIAENVESEIGGNLQLIVVPLRLNPVECITNQRKLFSREPGDPMSAAISMQLAYPVTRGYTHIKSPDPMDQLMINPRYLAHDADLKVLTEVLTFIDKMLNTEPLKSPEKDLQDPKHAESAVQDWVMTSYHPMGTCAMGKVVDSKLRVKDIQGLRVCDASIFPNNIRGNLVATVYAVAEKAADMIKADPKP